MDELKPLISIIIPVYNVAPYLEDSILSVLNQSLTDFELILVNDGSTDGSGQICDTYAGRDPRIRVLHQANQGVSVARNAGLEAARGVYVGFVDGDDWIEPDMYALLYENSLAYDAEISACGFIKVTNRAELTFRSQYKSSCCYTPEQAMKAMLTQNHMRYSACNKLFKKSLFEDIKYPEGKWIEDKRTTYKLIHLCQRIAWCPSTKYHYFLRSTSVSHIERPEKYIDFFEANEELFLFIQEYYPKLGQLLGVCYAAECLRILEKMKVAGYKDLVAHQTCMTYIRNHWVQSLLTPSMDVKAKCHLVSVLLSRGK